MKEFDFNELEELEYVLGDDVNEMEWCDEDSFFANTDGTPRLLCEGMGAMVQSHVGFQVPQEIEKDTSRCSDSLWSGDPTAYEERLREAR